MKALHVFLLSFLIASCGSDNSESNDPISCEYRICSDAYGDTDFSFIDIGDVQIKTEGLNIVVDINFLDIPGYLTDSNTPIPGGYAEYWWGIVFDVNRDNAHSGNVMFHVTYVKNSEDPLDENNLPNFIIREVQGISNDWQELQARIGTLNLTQDNNTVTFTVPKETHASLEEINQTTPFKVFAQYYSIEGFYKDSFPDYEGYID